HHVRSPRHRALERLEARARVSDDVAALTRSHSPTAEVRAERGWSYATVAGAQAASVVALGSRWGQLAGAIGNVGSVVGTAVPLMGRMGSTIGAVLRRRWRTANDARAFLSGAPRRWRTNRRSE